MTKSEIILAQIRNEISFGPEAGSKLAYLAGQLADEYEIAIAQSLRMEETIHAIQKKREGSQGRLGI